LNVPEYLIGYSSPRENMFIHRRLILKMNCPVKPHFKELSLQEITTRNMVNFFSHELIRTHKGEKSSKFFNDKQRRKLKELGILEQVYGYGGKRLHLSKKTRKMLGFPLEP
jgi:hypothetical protein